MDIHMEVGAQAGKHILNKPTSTQPFSQPRTYKKSTVRCCGSKLMIWWIHASELVQLTGEGCRCLQTGCM